MLYKDLTGEQQDILNEYFLKYGEIPEDATHIDDETSHLGDTVLKFDDNGCEYFFIPEEQRWKLAGAGMKASSYFPIPEDFCRKTGRILSHKPSEDVSNVTNTNTQDSPENVSESLTDAFKAIQELCAGKCISLSFDSKGSVQILTAYGDYVLDTNREDLQDVINKMADVNQIVKGEV